MEKLTLENLRDHAPEWAAEIHEQNVKKGWWPGGVRQRDVVETLLLIKTELVEAYEEYRKPKSTMGGVYTVGESLKPEGIPIEIADAAIRVMDFAGALSREFGSLPGPPWTADTLPIAESFAHAIDDEILKLSELRYRYEASRVADGETIAANGLCRQLWIFLVRLFNFAKAKDFDLGGAIVRKHAYNETREFRHGNKKA